MLLVDILSDIYHYLLGRYPEPCRGLRYPKPPAGDNIRHDHNSQYIVLIGVFITQLYFTRGTPT